MRSSTSEVRRSISALFLISIAAAWGCRKSASDADAIRAGITQHLSALNTLNLSAMDVNVDSVSIQGKQARAQVTFRPKSGAPPGTGMQVTYQLEKREAGWFVVKTEGLGGGIQHPTANANPHVAPEDVNVHGGKLPNLRELIPSTASPIDAQLPPGHPAIDGSGKTKPAEANQKPN